MQAYVETLSIEKSFSKHPHNCVEVAVPLNVVVQSTLVISKSKGPSETLRDICSLMYQICRIEENINETTKFHK